MLSLDRQYQRNLQRAEKEGLAEKEERTEKGEQVVLRKHQEEMLWRESDLAVRLEERRTAIWH